MNKTSSRNPVNLSRRRALQLIGGVTLTASTFSLLARPEQCVLTPGQTEGPFYPVTALSHEADLTQIKGKPKAQGTVIVVEGRILDKQCKPVANAQVDIWQANHFGRYRHPNDPNTAKLDPGFIGSVRLQSNAQGVYRIKTIFPGIYPAAKDWLRPPHIHFKIGHKDFSNLTTQMYFPGQELNEKDAILNNIPARQRPTVISRKGVDKDTKLPRYQFDIVLA
jgi:protocatechuate 3,4-dioxygenase beta subunit